MRQVPLGAFLGCALTGGVILVLGKDDFGAGAIVVAVVLWLSSVKP